MSPWHRAGGQWEGPACCEETPCSFRPQLWGEWVRSVSCRFRARDTHRSGSSFL